MRCSRLVILGSSIVLMLSACGGPGSSDAGEAVKLQGAGASFPAPLYHKWFKSYSAAHQNVLVDYQSVGSGSGVKSVIDHTVDFGASDAAMKTSMPFPNQVELAWAAALVLVLLVLAANLTGQFLSSSRAQ